MKNKQVKDCTSELRFNNKLKPENPEDFNSTSEQTNFLEAQLTLFIEGTKAGINSFIVRKI